MKCGFCEAESGDKDYAVDLYFYGGELVFRCPDCLPDCLGLQLDGDKRRPINLPDGWVVVPSDALADIKLGNGAFLEMRQALKEYVDKNHVPGNMTGYIYGLAGIFKRVTDHLEAKIKSHIDFLDTVGFSNRDCDITIAHCPNCTQPLLRMVGIKQRDALWCASSDLVNVMMPSRKKRNHNVLVCRGCGTAYIGKRKK